MNRSALRSRFQTRFRDTSADILSTDEVNDYLADAEADVYAASPWWPFHENRNEAFTVTGGTAGTALSADAVRVNAVYNATDAYPLVPIDGRANYRYAFTSDANAGSPTHYRFKGTTLEVYPRPASDVTLEIDYMVAPTVMDADEVEPAFPETYHRMLVSGALAYAYEDDGNTQQAALHRAKFEQQLERMMNDLLITRTERYHGIVDDWY